MDERFPSATVPSCTPPPKAITIHTGSDHGPISPRFVTHRAKYEAVFVESFGMHRIGGPRTAMTAAGTSSYSLRLQPPPTPLRTASEPRGG